MKSDGLFFTLSRRIAKGIPPVICPKNYLALFVVLIIFGCQSIAPQRTTLATTSASGAELFKSKCSKCHDPELALQEYRTEKVRYETITRMKVEHHADISQDEIERLVKYHVDRQKKEAALFNKKCQKCHPGKIFLEQRLTPDQARAIIKRMQQKAGNTIEDKDVEIIVQYHVRAQNAAVQASLGAVYGKVLGGSPKLQRGIALFVKKCSSCHNPSRALSVIKDPQVWAQTIRRMQYYSKGNITDQDVKDLVDFHVSRQQKEIDTFRKTCTKCHSDSRINSRSMSEEQWLATIKRMQKKAPELITDEKVNLLAAYFHRRELTMARIFYNRCQLCHYSNTGKALPAGSTRRMDGLIVLANQEFGQSLQIKDVNNLLSLHIQRQKRVMQLYENNCKQCHTEGSPEKKKPEQKITESRTRAEWISFIAALQGVELSEETQNAINNQIQYHISRH